MGMPLCLFCLCLFVCSLWWRCAHSQYGSASGQEGCVANVSISTSDISVVHVPPGTVCIECVFDGVLATDAEFQIDNKNIDENVGRVDDGVLVVYDTESVFRTSTANTTKCTNDGHMAQALVLLARETTINEGDMLDLDCDVSTSSPLPTAQWFSSQGDMISNSKSLEIMNIQRSAMGVYTCVANQFGATFNISVNVIVLPVFRPPLITGETTLNEGDTLNLDCNVSTSSPLPSVQWFSPQEDRISNSRDLEIRNIQRSAIGIYTCVATQFGATLNISVNVIILFFRPPVITGETTLNEGDPLNLDCNVSTSSPLPSVQWFSPQGDMISNSRYLQIMNIQRDKAGIYTCVATQLHSETTLNSTVNVIIICTARKITSESPSPWVYVMVVVIFVFMILVTLLAIIIIIVMICRKHSLNRVTTDLPKNMSDSGGVYDTIGDVQMSGDEDVVMQKNPVYSIATTRNV